jgi:hypothetical protein
MRRAVLLPVVLAVLMLFTTSVAASRHPDSKHRPPKDGCQRDPGGLVAGTSPQWAYVHRSRKPRYLRGFARNARPTETDLFRAHDSYDMNIFFHPNKRYSHYLGTANVAGHHTQDKDEDHTMEIEWEQRAYNLFAWPTFHDRVEVMGSWIWDCGHWGPQDFQDPRYFEPGTQAGEKVTGERTEIHPPRMVIVHRRNPSTSKRGDSVTDAIISSQGTFARGVENHAAGFCAKPEDKCRRWTPVNDRDYSFHVHAPPKPRHATKIRYRVIDRGSKHAPKPKITRTKKGIRVFVPFKGHGKRGERMVFAKRFKVGWDVPRPVRHLRVRLLRLKWLAELDGAQPFTCIPDQPCTGSPQDSQPPDEVNVYIDAAGQWRMLKIPGLLSVAPGQVFHLKSRFNLWLHGSKLWRLEARGRECDQPQMRECATPQEAGLNDDAGIFQAAYFGAKGALGRHVGMATSDACRVDAKSPCFKLVYRIHRIGHR